MIATFIGVESAKDPLEVPMAQPLGELGSRLGGGDEDGTAGSQFGEQAPGGKGICGTFGEDDDVWLGLVHGQLETALSLARAPDQGSESTAVGTLEGSDQFSSGGSEVGIGA